MGCLTVPHQNRYHPFNDAGLRFSSPSNYYASRMAKEPELEAITRVAIEHARHAMRIRLGEFKNDKYVSAESRLEHKLVAASLLEDSARITETLQGFGPKLGRQSLTPVPHEASWQLWDNSRGLYRCDTFSSFVAKTNSVVRGNPLTQNVIRYWVNDSGAGFGIQFRRTAKGSADRKLVDAAIASLPSHFERHLNRQKDFLESPIHLCGHTGSIFVGKWVGAEKISALISQLTAICGEVNSLLDT